MSRVMVVDDEAEIVEILKLALEDQGYEVSTAGGGEECLEKLLKEKPDVLLLDIMLPGITGLTVLKKIKEKYPEIAVIMITAYASLDSAVEAMNHGASHYLTKPLNLYDLKLVVKSVLEKRSLEMEVRRTKDFLEGIIESSPDSIITTDPKGIITSYNKGAEELFGWKEKEALGKSITGFYPPAVKKARSQWVVELQRGGSVRNKGVKMYDKEGAPVDVSLSLSLLKDGEKKPMGVIEIARDVRGEVRAEEEMMRKFMKYRVDLGNVYLVKENSLDRGLDVFTDMVGCGYSGVIISRDHPEDLVAQAYKSQVYWLTERNNEKAVSPEPEKFIRALENLLSLNKVVLLDRFDYLVSKNGFDKALSVIQELNELFYVERGVLIISLDPQTLDAREARLLEKETKSVKLKKAPAFPEDLRELLKFVYQMNKAGVKPPYKEVVKKFSITRTTARRRIRELKARGLMNEAKRGRSKVLELTPEGLEYF